MLCSLPRLKSLAAVAGRRSVDKSVAWSVKEESGRLSLSRSLRFQFNAHQHDWLCGSGSSNPPLTLIPLSLLGFVDIRVSYDASGVCGLSDVRIFFHFVSFFHGSKIEHPHFVLPQGFKINYISWCNCSSYMRVHV